MPATASHFHAVRARRRSDSRGRLGGREIGGRSDGLFDRLLDGRYEAITAARHGLDEARVVGGIAERLAEPADGVIQAVVELDEGVGGPQRCLQLIARDHLHGRSSRSAGPERPVGKLYPPPVFPQFARLEVDLKDTEAERSTAGGGRHGLWKSDDKVRLGAGILARQIRRGPTASSPLLSITSAWTFFGYGHDLPRGGKPSESPCPHE